MIVCLYTEIVAPWSNEELHGKASLLPAFLSRPILNKRNHLDIQLSLSGYLLLLWLIKDFKQPFTLNDLKFNQHKRPYFNSDFDFNISHSGNMVICCATTAGKIGVDIEKMVPVNINPDDYFNPAEQQHIRAARNPDSELIKLWTRKEAVLKAIGTGVFTPLLAINATADVVHYKSDTYYLKQLPVNVNYKSCIAVSAMQDLQITQIAL